MFERLKTLTIALALWGGTATAQDACRQALSLGLDISGSVDSTEYQMQMTGLANALTNPGVRDAFMSMPSAPIRLHVFEWAGLGTQRVLVDWVEIDAEDKLDTVARQLRSTARRPREVATALGTAMRFGAAALTTQGDCWKLTLDISGDGISNIGPRPREVQSDAVLAGLVINGLVIGTDAGIGQEQRQSDIAELSAYFSAEVIRGPDAFVITALAFEDYEKAMTRKLLRELEVLAIGALEPNSGGVLPRLD